MSLFVVGIENKNTLKVRNVETNNIVYSKEISFRSDIQNRRIKYLYNKTWKCKKDGKLYTALIAICAGVCSMSDFYVYKMDLNGNLHFEYEKSDFIMMECNNQLISHGLIIEWLYEDRNSCDDIAYLSIIDAFTGDIVDRFDYNCYCSPIPDEVTFLYPGIYSINVTYYGDGKYNAFENYYEDELDKIPESKKKQFEPVYPIWSHKTLIFGKNYNTNKLIFFDIYQFDTIKEFCLDDAEIYNTHQGQILFYDDNHNHSILHIDRLLYDDCLEQFFCYSDNSPTAVMIEYLLKGKSTVRLSLDRLLMPPMLVKIIQCYSYSSVILAFENQI